LVICRGAFFEPAGNLGTPQYTLAKGEGSIGTSVVYSLRRTNEEKRARSLLEKAQRNIRRSP
jgi:hypothetical protein